ncbi:hypothetical protein SEVIR_6G171800v4 [Setaria viridis]|uniref:Uncharacterized protein n=2 Tax=Setaria TaxID=4554 RepID=K3YKF3_SETIT|nr:uncharacterized protein LOC101759518 [Setaria italica]XP_034598745.1 uncharacterized protein LOC117859689 [Setaria viridis]RCV31303.1 hypothetical protein SETIT_6G166100v2 [Setaria italica]TKW10546.1 hypothetical protein SEVIR_6G171800v2 [Setaria viridis]
MEKKDLLVVRKRTPPKRRRKLVAPAKASGNGGARGLAKAIAAYLASDSYMYASLVPAPPPPPPAAAAPSAAPPISTPEKEVTLVQKYRGSWQATFTAN